MPGLLVVVATKPMVIAMFEKHRATPIAGVFVAQNGLIAIQDTTPHCPLTIMHILRVKSTIILAKSL
jgi:hypothetical protein